MKRNFINTYIASTVFNVLCIVLLCQSTIAHAIENYQSHDEIVEAATRHVQLDHQSAQRVTISITPPDKRLKLQSCSGELRVFWPPGSPKSGSTTLGVECLGRHTWKIYLRAVITVFDLVAVVSVPVKRGDVVSSNNVELQLTDISGVPNGTTREFKQWLTYRYKRQITPGRPLTLGMIEPPKLVHKGEHVTIINQSKKLTVRMRGTAMADGAEGARIRVQNNTSDRIVQGRVVSAGLVKVNP